MKRRGTIRAFHGERPKGHETSGQQAVFDKSCRHKGQRYISTAGDSNPESRKFSQSFARFARHQKDWVQWLGIYQRWWFSCPGFAPHFHQSRTKEEMFTVVDATAVCIIAYIECRCAPHVPCADDRYEISYITRSNGTVTVSVKVNGKDWTLTLSRP